MSEAAIKQSSIEDVLATLTQINVFIATLRAEGQSAPQANDDSQMPLAGTISDIKVREDSVSLSLVEDTPGEQPLTQEQKRTAVERTIAAVSDGYGSWARKLDPYILQALMAPVAPPDMTEQMRTMQGWLDQLGSNGRLFFDAIERDFPQETLAIRTRRAFNEAISTLLKYQEAFMKLQEAREKMLTINSTAHGRILAFLGFKSLESVQGVFSPAGFPKLSEAEANMQSAQPSTIPREAIKPSPVALWKASHVDELMKHRSKHVAINPDKGIVAVGPTMTDVYNQLERSGIDIDSIVFDYVR